VTGVRDAYSIVPDMQKKVHTVPIQFETDDVAHGKVYVSARLERSSFGPSLPYRPAEITDGTARDVVAAQVEAYNSHDLDKLVSCCTPNAVIEDFGQLRLAKEPR